MFTRASKILSNRLTVPLTSIAKAVGDVLRPTLNQLIKSLFANDEQGFAYDPNDLSTMFQDAAGTVAVTGAGQPVGLFLDKSKGLALSSELKQSALARMVGTAPVATYDPATGAGTVNRVDISNQSFIVFNDAVGKKWYKVSITNNSAALISLRNASMVAVDSTLANVLPNTTFSGYVYVNSGYMLGIAASTGNCGFTVNSIKEIAGNHAYQSTSASRPILRQNATTDAYYLEFDGSDDSLQTSNIDFTATDKVSLFAGVRKLSDASVGAIAEFSGNVNNNAGSFWLISPLSANANSVSFASRGNATTVASIGLLSAPANAVLRGVGDISGDNVSIYRNANLGDKRVTDQGAGNYGNYPLYIGRRAGTSLPFNGHIYGLIGIGRLTTDAETTALEKLIAKNTGVTLSV